MGTLSGMGKEKSEMTGAWGKLSDDEQRVLFTLATSPQMGREEISAALDMPIAEVSRHYSSAIKKIKESLPKQDNPTA